MQTIECPRCNRAYKLKTTIEDTSLSYCMTCGFPIRIFLTEESELEEQTTQLLSQQETYTQSPHHLFFIDRYSVVQILRQGGMGEVLLAVDKKNNRLIAIKRIRNELFHHPKSLKRFIREAKMTSRLSHPNIIPIYDFVQSQSDVFYTMPFVQGETLKTRLKRAMRNPGKQHEPDSGFSIQALLQIYLSICQATAYAHSKSVIHRDIKPDNILIGEFGDSYLFDWGIAKNIHDVEIDNEQSPAPHIPQEKSADITHFDRIVGTANFLPPEALMGEKSSKQNDIYALGVVLYQILTLSDPFSRPSIQKLRQQLNNQAYSFEDEMIEPPSIRSPNRDIPDELSAICTKCLKIDPKERYSDVLSLIKDLQAYLEGHSRWIHTATLDLNNNEQWKLQENIHLKKSSCFNTDLSSGQWVMLYISESTFRGKIKVQFEVTLGSFAEGIGIITNIPEIKNATNIHDGNCFWLASDIGQYSKFFQSNREVEYLPEIKIARGCKHEVIIEQIDNSLQLYINGVFQASFVVQSPLCATHIGLMTRDADFSCQPIEVYLKHENVSVSCLAVPHAFLSHKDYASAVIEYRRIAQAFPGREEARDALYYSGIALIEQARGKEDPEDIESSLNQALSAFDELHKTNAMPLALLGKSFVHKEKGEFDEEVKCYGIALHKHSNHPLLKQIFDHCIHRMHEAAQDDRKLTVQFSYLCSRYIPPYYISKNTYRFLLDIYQGTPLPFFLDNFSISSDETELFLTEYSFIAAFCTGHPIYIQDSVLNLFHHKANIIEPLIESLLSCASMNCLSSQLLDKCHDIIDTCHNPHPLARNLLDIFHLLLDTNETSSIAGLLTKSEKFPIQQSWKLYVALLEILYQNRQLDQIIDLRYQLSLELLPPDIRIQIDSYFVSAFILLNEFDQAKELMDNYQSKYLIHESHPLFSCYIAWLHGTGQEEFALSLCRNINHTNYPDIHSLVGHFLCNPEFMETVWLEHAFSWEIHKLYRQLELLYHAKGAKDKAHEFRQLEKQSLPQFDGF